MIWNISLKITTLGWFDGHWDNFAQLASYLLAVPVVCGMFGKKIPKEHNPRPLYLSHLTKRGRHRP